MGHKGHYRGLPGPLFFFFLAMPCRILVPRPGIEPVPPAVEAQNPNH